MQKRLSIVCLLAACLLHATNASCLSLVASSKIIDFNYREFNQHKNTLLQEKGSLLSTEFSMQHRFESGFEFLFEYESQFGEVGYDGATQSGLALQTDTQQHFESFSAEIKYSFAVGRFYIGPLVSIADWQWQREILATQQSTALNSRYDWQLYGLGINVTLPHRYGHIHINWMKPKTHNSSISVDLSAISLAKQHLDLKPGYGNYLELSSTIYRQSNWRFTQSLWLHSWRFGQSETLPINSGLSTFLIQEPASKTYQRGLSLSIQYQF